LIENAVADIDGDISFYVAKGSTPDAVNVNIGASSLLKKNPAYKPHDFLQEEIFVKSIRLDSWMIQERINFIDIIWMDLQGAELKALKGLGNRIKDVKMIYTEVEFTELYIGQPLFFDICSYLNGHGFYLSKKMSVMRNGWGNMLFVNEKP